MVLIAQNAFDGVRRWGGRAQRTSRNIKRNQTPVIACHCLSSSTLLQSRSSPECTVRYAQGAAANVSAHALGPLAQMANLLGRTPQGALDEPSLSSMPEPGDLGVSAKEGAFLTQALQGTCMGFGCSCCLMSKRRRCALGHRVQERFVRIPAAPGRDSPERLVFPCKGGRVPGYSRSGV